MKQWLFLILSIFLLTTAGCSAGKVKSEETSKEKIEVENKEKSEEPAGAVEETTAEKELEQEKESGWWDEETPVYEPENSNVEMTELEQELMKESGLYADNYNEQLAKEKILELPKGLSNDQYKEAILKLVRFDYHEEVEAFLQFDSSVSAGEDRPDEQIEAPEVTGTHFAILLDASGSMNAKNGSGTRMDEAKSAIMSFIEYLPDDSTVSLRVYGHKGTGSDADKALSCASTENIYTGAKDAAQFKKALATVKPAGWTPIGTVLAATKEDIPKDASSAVVYVVSDGIETCGGDPVAEAKKLAGEGIEPIINIIGFQVDNEAQQLLKKVAKAGNGEFTFANSKQDLDKYWKEEYKRLSKAWEEWRNAGMKEASEKQKELMDKADSTGKSIMDKSDIEFKRAEDLLNELFNNEMLEGNESRTAIWQMLYDRKKDVWGYGYHTKVEKWQESYHNGIEEWRRIYYEGNAKWQEYYYKK
ncbi:VWA domain-containing protein [Bacillus sp. FJAT-49711]|uniref:VWA domain-containing protein n=1 Tax=Bacillus sp. FJAT-49711 TaxID=2833585 RepID=UPI001BC9E12C|nr:VWA domain-containing protein [Bacillus sp. FJAT-49711]MBS4218429.1 VWA domain-containing protein [Bacillus sp. FJAT-49711]